MYRYQVRCNFPPSLSLPPYSHPISLAMGRAMVTLPPGKPGEMFGVLSMECSASRGASPQPPRATRSQLEPTDTVHEKTPVSYYFFWVERLFFVFNFRVFIKE